MVEIAERIGENAEKNYLQIVLFAKTKVNEQLIIKIFHVFLIKHFCTGFLQESVI